MSFEKRSDFSPSWGLIPYSLLAVLFFGSALFKVIQGIYKIPFNRVILIIKDPLLVDSALFTVKYSFISSLMAIILGTGVAWYLKKLPRTFRFWVASPHFVFAYLIWLNFTGHGFWARIFFMIRSEFPTIMNDPAGIGIILTYTLKEAPFVSLMLSPLMSLKIKKLDHAARTLGASPFQSMIKIVIPALAPSFISLFLILFTYGLSAFEIPYIVGPSYPTSLPVLALQSFLSIDLQEQDITHIIAATTTLFSLGIYLGAYLAQQKIIKDYE